MKHVEGLGYLNVASLLSVVVSQMLLSRVFG